MAKQLKPDPIGEKELQDYLDSESDFAFELRCLNLLTSMGLDCQHNGTYTDPLTKKPRQFDIRTWVTSGHMHVRCAVECKNLQGNYPLLMLCVPRTKRESYHQYLWSNEPLAQTSSFPGSPSVTYEVGPKRAAASHATVAPSLVYPPNGIVAKSCAQVGRSLRDEIVGDDTDVFQKWSQALASVQDVANTAALQADVEGTTILTIVVPMLVVPDGTLWQVTFDRNGAQASKPTAVERCSFFVDRDYNAGELTNSTYFMISHLEFVTMTGLKALIEETIKDTERATADRQWFAEPTSFE